jgi:nucleoid DNA-binding protein
MRTVTKKDMTDRIADGLKEKRTTVKTIVQKFLDGIVGELSKGNRCEFRDFGVFEIRVRKARMAQNPRTLERVPVPLKITV